MGLNCKPMGKFKGLLKKIENEQEKAKQKAKRKPVKEKDNE